MSGNNERRTVVAKTAKRIMILLVMVAILSLPATTLASWNVISYTIPVDDFHYFEECSSEGEGELVHFEGEVHIVVREDIWMPNGGHQNFHENWMGVQGTGMTTGDKYVRTGVFNLNTNVTRGAYEYTYSTGMKIVRQGSGDNYIVHNTIHLTLGPDGEVRAWIEFLSAECRG
jgi:hypothetical protein